MKNRCLYSRALQAIALACICLLLSCTSYAQVYLQMRSGWQSTTKRVLIAPAVSFSIYGFNLTPELVIYPKNDAPVHCGARFSYTFKFIEFGAGRYYEVYSTDKYDSYKNGWVNMAFAAAHWKSFFIEYGYARGGVFSLGVREKIGKKNGNKNYYY